jgi:hypothetical protein
MFYFCSERLPGVNALPSNAARKAEFGVRSTMWRRSILAFGFALAACVRDEPPAPLVSCTTAEQRVVIDGKTQHALATRCRDEDGRAALRPEHHDPSSSREAGSRPARAGPIASQP